VRAEDVPASLAVTSTLPLSRPVTTTEPSSHRLPENARPSPSALRRWERLTRGPWPLVAILAVQAALSLRLIWSNTAFGDEALYLWAGHLEWTHWEYGTPVPNFAAYFSGAPVVYPPLAAVADALGGLAGARILSLFFMLGATALLYTTTIRLFGSRQTALFACALFVSVGPTADLGAFATYDAMAIFLLALATRLAISSGGRMSELLLACAALSMAVADSAKYASLLWNPVVIALAGLAADGRFRRVAARAFRLTCYSAAVLMPALFVLGGKQYMRGISFTTLDRYASNDAVSAAAILTNSAYWAGLLAFLALVGVVAAGSATSAGPLSGRRPRLTAAVLAVAVFLAPLHQAQIHTLTSLYKHIVFGCWFGAAAAGVALAKARSVNQAKGWRIGIAAVVFVAILGVGQASNMFAFWPDSARMIAAVRQELPTSNGQLLAANADGHVINYYLGSLAGPNGVSDPDSAPPQEMRAMINEGAFSLVIADLPCGADPGECQVLKEVAATHQYRAWSVIPWSDRFGSGKFVILRRKDG
jgi:hypothetical protein